jgi:hypothetical protein
VAIRHVIAIQVALGRAADFASAFQVVLSVAENRLTSVCSGGRAVPIDAHRQRVDTEAARLADLGSQLVGVLEREGLDHYAVGMKDPEDNESDIN